MALKQQSSGAGAWVAPILFCVGLLCVFLAERILSASGVLRGALSGGGCALVAVALAVRVRAALRAASSAERRTVERLIALAYAGASLALVIYFATTHDGLALLGVDFAEKAAEDRFHDVATVAWVLLLAASLVPALAAERAYAPMRTAADGVGAIEGRRVRTASLAGLDVVLAGALLMVGGWLTAEHDVRWDFSYFKTSRPGDSTRAIAASTAEPVKVTAFFPDVNEVGDEVDAYVNELAAQSGGKLLYTRKDRLLEPKLSEELRVTQDGVLVFQRGDRKQNLVLGTKLDEVRAKLKNLDRDVQKALLELVRERRIAYLVAGHGELNDAGPKEHVAKDVLGGAADANRPGVTVLRKLLEAQNYSIKTLSLSEGLATDVPEDATMVLVVGPRQPLMDEELSTLARYAQRGGKLLVALEPEGEAKLGALGDALGVTYDGTPLCNDKLHLNLRGNASDCALLATNRYSSHASVTTLSRYASEFGVVFLQSGSLERAQTPPEGAKIDFVVRALPDTFADPDRSYALDEKAGEKRQSFNLTAAIERVLPVSGDAAEAPKGADGKDDKKKEPPTLRAIVLADADAIGDDAMGNRPNVYFLADLVRWLGGEESFAGATQSEEDVRIEHTQKGDAVWFYGTAFAVPGALLGFGLFLSWRSRRRRPAATPRGDVAAVNG